MVFLRAYNDIDHIVPVIHKWVVRDRGPVEAVVTAPHRYLQDYRIQHIAGLDAVEVNHLDEYLPHDQQRGRSIEGLPKYHPLRLYHAARWRLIGNTPSFPNQVEPESIDHILKSAFRDEREGVVACDWTYGHFAQNVTKIAQAYGLPTVALPHGDRPFINSMIQTDQLEPPTSDSRRKIYDYTIVPNESYREWMLLHLPEERVKALGSPRFNTEWILMLDKLLEPYQGPDDASKLKVVLFLRKESYSLFVKEVLRTIHMISRFDDVHLVVKGHTRGKTPLRMIEFDANGPPISDLENVEVCGKEIHSSPLIRWADVILDMGTTVPFEAIMRKKPILEVEYLHANRSTIAHHLPETEVRYRDALYKQISGFIEEGVSDFYTGRARERFIRRFIEYPDNEVLDRYIEFLSSMQGTR